jgi:hypothetical protein
VRRGRQLADKRHSHSERRIARIASHRLENTQDMQLASVSTVASKMVSAYRSHKYCDDGHALVSQAIVEYVGAFR